MNNKDRTWYLIGKKLANEANVEELAELEELLRSDPELHYALHHLNDLWNLPVPREPEAENAFERHLLRLQAGDTDWEPAPLAEEQAIENVSSPTRSWPRRFLMPAVIATVIIAVAFFVFYSPPKETPPHSIQAVASTKNEVSTRNGSRTKISLPDGSQVWLNSGSNIIYPKEFGNKLREVELSGEAYFDVVKNTEVPFIIHTTRVDIRVVGTAFNVRSYPGERQTETSLIRGIVEVSIRNRAEKKIILKPNEKLVVTDNEKTQTSAAREKNQPFVSLSNLTYTKSDSLIVETAWVQDKLVFDNESFEKVAAKMERWYNVQFEFSDSMSKGFRFTGVFQDETIQQALEALKITAGHNFRYVFEGNKVIIRRNNFLIPN